MSFIDACRWNDVDTVKSMLISPNIDQIIMNEFYFWKSPLHSASEYGHDKIVRLLLDSGKFDPNHKDICRSYTPLMYACNEGHVNIVKILLNDSRVNINEVDKHKFNCLKDCCLSGNYELTEIILTNPKFDKNDVVSIKESYECACIRGYCEILKLLIVLIDNYEFKLLREKNRFKTIVTDIVTTFKGSDEYNMMRYKYFKDYYAGCIFYNIVMINDDYLKIK